MGEKKKFISRFKGYSERPKEQTTKKVAEAVIPAVYASLAIALSESGMDSDVIEYLFGRSQAIWTAHSGNLKEMVTKCEELTGIEVRFRDEHST